MRRIKYYHQMEERIPRISIGKNYDWNNYTSGKFNFTSYSSTDGQHNVTITGSNSDKLIKELQWFFELHAYLFGCMFFILAFYTFSSVLIIRTQISKRRFMSGINTFLCILGLSRAASLFIDPYGLAKMLPSQIRNVLWSVGFPSLSSSFCLLQLAVLHLTKLKIGASILRTEVFLRTMITLHISSSVLMAIISTLHRSKTMVIIDFSCEVLFLCWSIFLYGSFLFIGYKVSRQLDRVPLTMLQNNQNRGIMQMVMLAPQNNLASSVTAALMPTILRNVQQLPAAKPAAPATVPKYENKRQCGGGSSTSLTSNLVKPGSIKTNATTALSNNANSHDSELGEGASKMKKLKWQSSISNGSKIDCDLTIKKTSNLSHRPILKDYNKPDVKINGGTETEINTRKKSIRTKKEKLSTPEPENKPKNNDEPKNKQGSTMENDLLLQSILNHIAYVNRANSDSGLSHSGHTTSATFKRSQVRTALWVTYTSAILGVVLCFLQFFKEIGPYGLLGSILNIKDVNAWYWISFETVCRLCEILIASCIANVTKQPSSSIPRYYKHNPSIMIKQRESMFI